MLSQAMATTVMAMGMVMAMEDMDTMDTMVRGQLRQSQDTATMVMDMVMDMVMVIDMARGLLMLRLAMVMVMDMAMEVMDMDMAMDTVMDTDTMDKRTSQKKFHTENYTMSSVSIS